MADVFLLGATGYIGGDVLYALNEWNGDIKIRALVRSDEKGNDVQLIEKEASASNVVIHLAATGHLESSEAILKGIASRKNGYYIQVSGATILSQDEIKAKTFGEASNEVANDVDGLQGLVDIIGKNPQRAVDNLILNASQDYPSVRTALVIGPLIYGKGRGPLNQRSIQIPELSRIALQRGRAVQIGKGLNRWGNVHVADLSDLIVRLVERAIAKNVEEQLWGRNCLYLAGSGKEMTFGEISRHIAQAACRKHLIHSEDIESITADEADKLSPHASAIMGTNAREEAQRAKLNLGWKPTKTDLQEEIYRCVLEEATRLKISHE